MKRGAAGEAPGRLDFMGGVADYSGSLVLQTPIRGKTRVRIDEIEAGELRLSSRGHPDWAMPLGTFCATLTKHATEADVRRALDEGQAPKWVYYVLGCLWVFSRAARWKPSWGLSFRVTTRTPQSMGVSSSAALEVATLRALCDLIGKRFQGTELARLGQRAENLIVGAPCGLMDQLAVDHGLAGHLLPIVCRPDELRTLVRLQAGVTVVGWPSGVAHSVGGLRYGKARTATFMGKRIFESESGKKWDHAAEIPPSLFHGRAEKLLPERISGRSFRRRYGRLDDPLSTVSPGTDYHVRSALRFPVGENFRCELAESLLRANGNAVEGRLRQVGELMYQSHRGYTGLGLGTDETDRMVEAVAELGSDEGFYGARVSGGGCGGTVVVLLRTRALPKLRDLASRVRFTEKKAELIR